MAEERLLIALMEIQRRRELASDATIGPWRYWNDGHVGSAHPDARLGGLFMPTVPANDHHGQRLADARYVADNDPTHVLAVLDAADGVLRRHAPAGDDWRAFYCGGDHPKDWNGDPDESWPCDEARAVLDVYAPVPSAEVTS